MAHDFLSQGLLTRILNLGMKSPIVRAGLKENQKACNSLTTVMPLLSQWAHLASQVSTVAFRVQCCVRPLVSFSLGNLHMSFGHHANQTAGTKLPSYFETELSMWCLW